MKHTIIWGASLYVVIAMGVFALHTQLPVTFGLALIRSALWPVWFIGGIKGTPLPMD